MGWGQRLDWGQLLVSMKCRRRLTPWSGESFNRKVGRNDPRMRLRRTESVTRQGPSLKIIAGPKGSACVSLPESPTTGVRWELEDSSKSAHLVSSTFMQTGEKTVGGGGTRIFCMNLRGLESVVLAFVLRRTWESEPIERRVLTVSRR